MIERLANGSGYRTRVRFGPKQRRRFRIALSDEAQAVKRAAELVQLGAAIGAALIGPELGARLLERAGAGEMIAVRAVVSRLAAGLKVERIDVPKPGALQTMRELGQAWTSGELATRYPDHVRRKATSFEDERRLKHLCKTIGNVRVSAFTLADAETAMAALPRDLESTTRRHYAQILSRMLNLAVYPLKLIERSPLPKGFLPKIKRTKATAYLYPAEDAQLMAASAVPLARRLLYGFLAREGCRCGEALTLRWSDLDLKRGAVALDKNKTDDPRAWALAPGVGAALARFQPKDAQPGDLVFEGLDGEHMAEGFRADLKAAKIDRAELFERSKTRRPVRLHDLRGTFVTLSLAAGKTETWVSDRTGHRSSVMINAYRRAARTAAELGLGGLAPLERAIKWREQSA